MKLPSLVAAVVVSTLGPAFALIETDLAPAALAGKTMTFSVEYGATPFAIDGSWTGTFESSPANGFTIKNVTGATVDSNSTQTFKESGFGVYTYTITPFIAGQKPGSLSLWISAGIGHYEIAITDLFGTSQGGTFTIGSAVVKAPEIGVLHEGAKLTDGSAKIGFGSVKSGKSGTEKFVIRNSGKAKLTGLKISRNGTNKLDFSVTALAKTSLAAGESMNFNVIFKPSATGKKSAAIHISSNDADESPFDIKLTGEGTR